MKKLALILFTLPSSLFTFHISDAQVINVPADQPSIQAGINAASNGDTVLVADGTYYENINFRGKAITVASHFILDGDTNLINSTIINGSQAKDPDSAAVVMFVSGEDTTSMIRGFTITGGTGLRNEDYNTQVGGGIVCINSGARIANNKITGNTVTHPSVYAGGGGIGSILVTGDPWIIVENNLIAGNHVSLSGYQAYAGGLGITCNARVTGNVIRDNTCINTGNAFNAEASGGGFEVVQFPGTSIDVAISDNAMTNNYLQGRYANGAGIRVQYCNPYITGNTIMHNTGTAVKTAYGGGLHIWEPGGDIYIANNEISNNVINGEETDGGGVFIHLPFKVEFINNTIIHNSTTSEDFWYGAGMLFNDPQDELIIKDNWFSGNSGHIYSQYPEPVDFGNGGAMVIADALFNEILIDGNYFIADTAKLGGAVYFRNSYNLMFSNNVLTDNMAYLGGVMAFEKTGSTNEQGGISRELSRPVVVNNTFLRNTADYKGGAIYCNAYDTESPVIFNNIFRSNHTSFLEGGHDIFNDDTSGTILVAYSIIADTNIRGKWTGEGNFDADPGFIDDTCHIDQSSPCYDAGADSIEFQGTWYYAPDHDFEGSWRPFGSSPDIGADEWDGDGTMESLVVSRQSSVSVYPNPTSGIVDFRFSILDSRSVSLKIYDVHGREVAMVLEGRRSGDKVVRWDASNLRAGVYFYRLRAEGIEQGAAGKILKH